MAVGGPSDESSSSQYGNFPEPSGETPPLEQQTPYWTHSYNSERIPLGLVAPPEPNMRTVVERRRDGLNILIPLMKLSSPEFLLPFIFVLVWHIAFWTVFLPAFFPAAIGEESGGFFPILFLTPFAFVGIYVFRYVMGLVTMRTHIFIGYDDYVIQHTNGNKITKEHKGQTRNIGAVRLTTYSVRSEDLENYQASETASTVCEVVDQGIEVKFGEKLIKREQEWILREIGAFMSHLHNNNNRTSMTSNFLSSSEGL